MYIASQLTSGRVGHRRIMTKITFDKGGFWQPVAAPKVDNNGMPLNCSLVGDLTVLVMLLQVFVYEREGEREKERQKERKEIVQYRDT